MSAAALALAAAEEGGASAAAPDASGKSKKGARPCFRRNLQAGSCMTGRQTPVRRSPAGPRLEPGVPRLNPWKITLRLQGGEPLNAFAFQPNRLRRARPVAKKASAASAAPGRKPKGALPRCLTSHTWVRHAGGNRMDHGGRPDPGFEPRSSAMIPLRIYPPDHGRVPAYRLSFCTV
ncbi:hypothetical F-121 protein [Human adenovirus 6]|uniref:Hypothetical F-121 protein n=1 Tax=Human adenovirus C serotype 6 TaxID=10534 RepID=E1U5N2_ADE06|nr:hypothetical F-121 protein [Human adenovirus 6]